MLYRWLQNHYAKRMPYQSENYVIHGYKFTNDYYDDDAFDFSHWDNDDNSIVYFIPTIEDKNDKHFSDHTISPTAYWAL